LQFRSNKPIRDSTAQVWTWERLRDEQTKNPRPSTDPGSFVSRHETA